MAADRIVVHVSWIEDDEELIRPLTSRLATLQHELDFQLEFTRHPLGPGLDADEALDTADVILLMVSPAYLAARSSRRQVDRARDRQQAGATAMSIVVRKSDLRGIPRDLLLPEDGGSIEQATDQDAVYDGIVGVLQAEIRRRSAPEETAPEISASTRRAIAGLRGDVPASAIVGNLLELHPEYGGGAARSLGLVPTATERPVPDWLERLRGLYREDAVPVLHGRSVIRGLALLEPDLMKQLLDHGFISTLEGELRPPLDDALSPYGRRLWEPGKVRTHADRPASEDQLRREHFAKGLADMIEEERRASTEETGKPESFLVHLHGPWGSGKTSLLGFLGKQLRKSESRWVVVEFNAWQHERLGAPWWSLMTAVHREGLRAPIGEGHARGGQRRRDLWRSMRLLWFDLAWRVRLGWMAYLVLPVVLGLLFVGFREGFFDAATDEKGWLTQAGDIAKPMAAIVGLIVALLGAARGLGRSLAVGSARGAETFMKTSRDPMRTLRKRYEKLVSTIGRPIAVFIDDMDRCQSSYVVEVLQGVQTLLIEAPVTYIVAADRRWLYDSYAKVYADFRSVAREPGRPLGHLFLEKTFQLSAALPQLPPDVRDEYWGSLIAPERDTVAADESGAVDRARERARAAGLDEVVAGPAGDSAAEQRAERAELSEQIADPQVQKEIENRLRPFSTLLEPNPRAMKRLINAYQIELRRLLAEGRRVGRSAVTPEQIALWTIVSLRWPLLADQLALQPGLLAGAADDRLPQSLRRLWASDDVRAVVEGDGVPARLTQDAVRALVGLGPSREAQRAPAEGNGAGTVPSVA